MGIVATVLTACGIETCSLIKFSIVSNTVATVLTVYGIETHLTSPMHLLA